MKKIIYIITIVILCFCIVGCDYTPSGSRQDVINTADIANTLQENQPTPNDVFYSLERYNLIRRTYWVNGQREKANSLPCEIEKPLGYIVLFSGNAVVGNFVVDGKVTSLNSFLTPDSEYYEYASKNKWLADVDGSYGENDDGIFFFDIRGNYIEWTGNYLYTDIPMEIADPIVKFEVKYD